MVASLKFTQVALRRMRAITLLRRSQRLWYCFVIIIAGALSYHLVIYASMRGSTLKDKTLRKKDVDHQMRMHSLQSITTSTSKNFSIMPGFLDFLPHLRNISSDTLRPALVYPDNSRKASIVIGISTVPRDKYYYMNITLTSLISGLSDDARQSIIFVLMLADDQGPNTTFVTEQVDFLSTQFRQDFDSGLIEIIVPPREWYPADLKSVPPNFEDSQERMYWRTKQNLDFMYLILYCQHRGEYYLHLEDDVIALPGYIMRIKEHIRKNSDNEWFMLEFTRLGFIGKLFRSADLKLLIQYIALFYRLKPVDWLLDLLFVSRYCSPEWSSKHCVKTIHEKYRLWHVPALFLHIGAYSSLSGKVHTVRDAQFPQSQLLYIPHLDNPPVAQITTSLNTARPHDIESIYRGRTYCRAFSSSGDDYIEFVYKPPIDMISLVISTGNVKYPEERFPTNTLIRLEYPTGVYEPKGRFNMNGTAIMILRNPVRVKKIRIDIRGERGSWFTINEIQVIAL